MCVSVFFFYAHAHPRDTHVLAHSFPTRRSSDLGRASVERNQERVERIKKLKEELHREEERQKEAIKESDGSTYSCGSVCNWI